MKSGEKVDPIPTLGFDPGTIVKDAQGDYVCQHGVAMDVHCCHCHSGFIFDLDHVCPPAEELP